MIDFSALAAPFPPSAVSWRIGATSGDNGLPLAFIDARDVMDRLDSVCGPAGWQCRYPTMGHVTICEIGILCGNEWIWKADGAGQTDVEGEKGILSDAFKRAGYRWGVGRYLYGIEAPWVKIEKRGKSTVIAKGEYARLEALLAQQAGTQPSRPTPPPSRPELPPAEPEVEEGARNWCRQQAEFLKECQLDTDIFEWDDRNARALQKLQLQHRDMWDRLTDIRLSALERVSNHAQKV